MAVRIAGEAPASEFSCYLDRDDRRECGCEHRQEAKRKKSIAEEHR